MSEFKVVQMKQEKDIDQKVTAYTEDADGELVSVIFNGAERCVPPYVWDPITMSCVRQT